MPYREIVFVTDEVLLFYQKQQPKIQRKIDFVFDLIRNVEEYGLFARNDH